MPHTHSCTSTRYDTTRHLHLHSCMRRVCMCMCVYMCASCSLHFYTCSRFSYFHAARTFYPTPLAFIFALFFAHFYLRRLLAIWNSFFFFFLFCCFALPCTHDFQSPVAFKRSRQTERKRTESEKRAAAAAAARAAGERQGCCCCCCTHLRLLHSPVCQSSVGLRDSLSLSLGLLLLCNWVSGTRAVPLSASTH